MNANTERPAGATAHGPLRLAHSRRSVLPAALLLAALPFTQARALDCMTPDCGRGTKFDPAPPRRSDEIRYTIWNDTNQAVRFRLPSGRVYVLQPGQRGSYHNHGDDLAIHVFNTGRTYALASGEYKFRWMRDQRRLGFSLD